MAEPPRRLGRYELLMPLGDGGMGEVFAARLRGEASFERLFAAKRVRPDLKLSERLLTMFFDEARTAACIHSPYVVSVLDVGREGDAPFMIMELVLGASVGQVGRALGPLPPELVVAIGLDASQGLADAHAATDPTGRALGIVHRDVTPNNLLVGLDGRTRVTDFGIARAIHREWETSGRGIVGTLGYFSPEQTRGVADRTSDVFSLGVVLWELLTHRRLFTGDRPIDVLTAVCERPIAPPHELAPRVPVAVSMAVMRALERDRARRLPTAAALHRALDEALRVGPDAREELGAMARELSSPVLAGLAASARQSVHTLVEAITRRDAAPVVTSEAVPVTPSVASTDPSVAPEPSPRLDIPPTRPGVVAAPLEVPDTSPEPRPEATAPRRSARPAYWVVAVAFALGLALGLGWAAWRWLS